MSDSDESTYYTKVYQALDIVCLVGCLLIIPFSKLTSSVLFAPSYHSAWQYIPFLTLSAYFSCLSGFLASAFRAYKKTGQLFVSVALGALFNVILNIVLIRIIGPLGAAIATASSFMITWAIRMITIQRLVRVKISLIKTVITYTAVVMACLLESFEIPYANLIYILLSASVILINIKALIQLIRSVLKSISNKFTW
jgi:O-antigen/teichoic acid export membrane protein